MVFGLVFAGGGQSQNQNTPMVRTAGPADPFGKYVPGIRYSNARTLASTIFHPDDPDMRSLEENIWARAFESYLGITLEYKWIGTDDASHNTRWNAAIASGDLPDFGNVSAAIFKQLYDAGYMAEMDQIFADYASEQLKNTSEFYLDMLTMDGKLYGFPISRGGGNNMVQLHIREDWLNKVGLGLPKTFEEVVNAARAFQRANLGGNDTVGMVLSNDLAANAGTINGVLQSFGAYNGIWLDVNGSLVYSQTLPEWKDGLLALQSLYREGIINRDFAAIRYTEVSEIISSQRSGMTYGGSWSINGAIESVHTSDSSSKFAYLLLPQPAGKSFKYHLINADPIYVFVSARSRYPEAAVKIANLCWKLSIEDYDNYYAAPPAGGYRYRYMPWSGMSPANPYQDNYYSAAIVEAERNNGVLPQWALTTLMGVESIYERYKLSLIGQDQYRLAHYYYQYGGTYWNAYTAIRDNRHQHNMFTALPTETMALMGNVINDEINMAIFDVIMGADISTFERAVERWKTNGGNRITQEVNAWYRSIKK